MELRALRYYITVAEELNITAAAEKLNMSQPPLSAQMKNLEYELNTVLFIRGKRHLQLTESGQLLYRRAKEIVNLADKAKEEILALNSGLSGTISIGLVEGMAAELAAGWFASFMKENPQVRFRSVSGGSDELIEKMRGGLISLAVIAAPFDQVLLNSIPVGSERLSVYLSPDHPLAAERSPIGIGSLKNVPLILPARRSTVESVYRWFRSVRCEPTVICEAQSGAEAAALTAHGAGACIYTDSAYFQKNGAVRRELEGDDKTVDYCFVWLKGHPLPTAEEKLIDCIRDWAGNRLQNEST